MPSPEQQRRQKKLIRYLKRGKTLRKLANDVGVSHGSIDRWERGGSGISGDGQIKIAAYLNVPLSQLRQYLNGELSLDELLEASQIAALPSDGQLSLGTVIQWFKTLPLTDIMQLLHALAARVMELTHPKEVTIASLFEDWELQELHEALDEAISVERLAEIEAGDRPSDGELIDLAMVLVKNNGEPWTTHELMEIRDRTTHRTHEEKQANGK